MERRRPEAKREEGQTTMQLTEAQIKQRLPNPSVRLAERPLEGCFTHTALSSVRFGQLQPVVSTVSSPRYTHEVADRMTGVVAAGCRGDPGTVWLAEQFAALQPLVAFYLPTGSTAAVGKNA